MMVDWKAVRADFMLQPGAVYLNGGTFSALPRPVYEAQIRLMAAGELDPTMIACRRRGAPLWGTQRRMAAYLGCAPEDLIFHFNVTQALNQAIFCFDWPSQGEFLVSDLEYGAIVHAVREMARRRGLTVRVFPLPCNPRSETDVVDAVTAALSPDTVGILVSHVVSSNGLLVPVERIAPRLRERGVTFLVDGAHAPGLVPLNLGASGIDFYGGNLHKWFMGPKSTAFLYVDRALQRRMKPHIVGWGGVDLDGPAKPSSDFAHTPSRFQHVFRIQGLYDASPFLALEAALDYRAKIGEKNIRRRIDDLGAYARRRMETDAGCERLSPSLEMSAGLVAFRVPWPKGREPLEAVLHRDYRITVAAHRIGPDAENVRLSPHIWNDEEEIDRLARILGRIKAKPGAG